MKVGIIGLEYAGKKSLFSLLTGKEETQFTQTKEEIGTVNVPDFRVDDLADFYKTTKKVYSQIEFHLLPSIKKDSKETSKALVEAKEVDMLALVIRQFTNENVFHPYEKIDMQQDYSIIKNELVFADLFLIESRLDRLEKQLRAKKEDILLKEKDLLLKLKENLEKGLYLNTLEIPEDSLKLIKGFNLFTLKPIFIIVNCDDDKLNHHFDFPDQMQSINMSIKIENEIQQLAENEKKEFLESLGLKETSLNRLIKFTFDYGQLISFFTAGEKESHAWTIKKGTTALKAAGTIHTDFEKGFIRAEVIHYDDLKKAGSEANAKKMALYHLEGKEYMVKDGDIIIFRFNL